MTIEKQGVGPVVDPMSLQYLVEKSSRLYRRPGISSRFTVTNPNAQCTCVLFLQHLIVAVVPDGDASVLSAHKLSFL